MVNVVIALSIVVAVEFIIIVALIRRLNTISVDEIQDECPRCQGKIEPDNWGICEECEDEIEEVQSMDEEK